MALFVHLARGDIADGIRRSGIKPHRARICRCNGYERVVFAMPVTDNFYISHQWMRELKRDGRHSIVGVYFRVPDQEKVLVGHYNKCHIEMAANDAIGLIFNAEDAEGYEVSIPRKIDAKEIHDVRQLSKVVGWRYFPDSHGRQPCGCPACLSRGEIKSKRIRQAFKDSF
jgi:hypothetical protein